MPQELMGSLFVILGVGIVLLLLFLASLKNIIYICAPNEVLIFSGPSRRAGAKRLGYQIIKGGRGYRIPMLTRVDRMDLSNMVIDLTATGAYGKGGIPLTVQGVANIKIAGHEPLLNNAIERFLGRNRQEIVAIAKATLEGSLRGVLATMTPEQVNEDKILFAERLVQEVEQDMTALGLVVDTLKIQNVQDEVKYLDSIGRKKSAEVVSKARIAEALASAESRIRSSENLQRESKAQIDGQISVTKADAERKLTEIRSRREALIAEEMATVNALIAKTEADIAVQTARLEQVKQQLDADVIQPAKAAAEASEEGAVAMVANIIEEGRARAEALKKVAMTLKSAGPNSRELLLMQKLPSIIDAMTNVIAETKVDKVTVIDTKVGSGGGDTVPFATKALVAAEQINQIFGFDVVETLKGLAPSARQSDSRARESSRVTAPVVSDVVIQGEPVEKQTPPADPPKPQSSKQREQKAQQKETKPEPPPPPSSQTAAPKDEQTPVEELLQTIFNLPPVKGKKIKFDP